MAHAGIDNIDHGMSVQRITEYFEALRTGSIQKAMEACTGPEFEQLKRVLAANWVGTSHDRFVQILDQSATITAETIANMTGVLASQLNRMIEVWREQEDKLIMD